MPCDEDCRTAVLGKTERTVGWEGDGEPTMNELLRHCIRGKPAAPARLALPSLSHSFTLDLVVLVSAHPRQGWLRAAVEKRLRDELAKLGVEVNEAKTRTVDLCRGECFGFLGFVFRLTRSRLGRRMPLRLPQAKKRTALLRRLKTVFGRYRSQPVARVIEVINPILRGWVNYFAYGHASRCFAFIQNWVEHKIRRHLARARQRRGFGWKRWSRQWLYEALGVFNDYRVRYQPRTVVPV
jgi:RNA-directed DNA polymerase